MQTINRSIVTLVRKKLFNDWIEKVRGDLDAPNPRECSSYLLPPADDEASVEELLELNADLLFELELSQWSDDKSLWPKELSYQNLLNWFDFYFSAYPLDLEDEEEICHEDLE